MKRRSKPANERRRKTVSPRPRKLLDASPHGRSSAAGEETKLAQLTRELSEALQQQTATLEVLEIISGSPGEWQSVLNAILTKAVRICGAENATVWSYQDGALCRVARHIDADAIVPIRASGGSVLARMLQTKQPLQVTDYRMEQAYLNGDPFLVAAVEQLGIRSYLSVPMLKDNEIVGALSIWHKEVRPFTEKQIELIATFANQAVIALENARLLDELRKRTDQVVELNQQLERRVADQVGEIERMSRLRRFLPPQVADLIVASGTEKQLESHRREIAALFCDLRGFTGFSEASAPEDVMALLRDYHAAIGGIIIKYSGTLERYAGDGVMVVFNDPVPVDNPALRAVQMALETREAMGGLMEKWRQLGTRHWLRHRHRPRLCHAGHNRL
jgi:class 3 adenylate cyclase